MRSASSPVAIGEQRAVATSRGHVHEHVGVESATLGIVRENPCDRDRLLTLDTAGRSTSARARRAPVGFARAADQQEREHHHRAPCPARDEPRGAERDGADEQHTACRMRSRVFARQNPGRQSADRQHDSALVHLTP